VDVRIITATHRDLAERVRNGAFREDLLYRLHVVSIDLPALRHRREDIPELAEHFLRVARLKYPASPVERIGPEALARLLAHDWPGNVRELSHVIERMAVLGKNAVATPEDLPVALSSNPAPSAMAFGREVIPFRDLQTRYAAWALEQMNGHRGRTAERLGVDSKTLAKWLSRDDNGSEPSE
jgi:two-component system response regulator HydG